MKILPVFLLSFMLGTFGFGQNFEIKAFLGSQTINDFELKNVPTGQFDSSYLFIQEVKNFRPYYYRLGFSYRLNNNTFLELSGLYDSNKGPYYNHLPIDSFPVIPFSTAGVIDKRYLEINVGMFRKFNPLKSQKFTGYIGYEARVFSNFYEFSPKENTPHLFHRREAIGFSLNWIPRVKYKISNRFDLEMLLGISTIEIARMRSNRASPSLSKEQREHTIFHMDLLLDAFFRVGISYKIGKKKKPLE